MMFNTLWNRFVSLVADGRQAEQREVEVYLAKAKTLEELEHRQREIERGGTHTHILSGW